MHLVQWKGPFWRFKRKSKTEFIFLTFILAGTVPRQMKLIYVVCYSPALPYSKTYILFDLHEQW